MARLGDVCTFYSGTGFPNEYQGKKSGQYPFYKVGDISKNVLNGTIYLEKSDNYVDENVVKTIKGNLIPSKTVVFAKIGEALRLNRRAITTCACLIDNNVMGIHPNEHVLDLSYFYHWMTTLDLQKYSESTTVPSVRKTRICEIEISILPLEEQNRIAAILDKVECLISLRKQQLAKLDELVKARFVEMFRDPIANSADTPKKPLGEICILKAGITTSADEIHEFSTQYQIPCYGGNGIRGYVKKSTQHGIYPIIGRQGALCGNVQLASGDFHATEHAVLVTPFIEVDIVWLFYLLKYLDLYRFHTGAAQPGLAVKTLNTVEVPLATIESQKVFSSFSQQIHRQKLTIQQSLDKMGILKKTLMQEYFG